MELRNPFQRTYTLYTSKLLVISLYLLHSISYANCDPANNPRSGEHLPESERNASSTRLDSSVELVFGAFSQEMENTWFYETYYPIILKLPVPGRVAYFTKQNVQNSFAYHSYCGCQWMQQTSSEFDWSTDAHRLNQSLPKCRNDDKSPNYLCPVQYHQDGLLLGMSQNSRFFKNIYVPMVLYPSDNAPTQPVHDINLSCAKIKPHFHRFASTTAQMKLYMKDLSNCPLAKNLSFIWRNVSGIKQAQLNVRKAYQKFTENEQAGLVKLQQKGIMDTYVHGTNSTANVTIEEWKFLQMVGYTSFQNAFTLATYIESLRWANGFSACQANRLDIGLVPPQLLEELLVESSLNLTKLGLGYNISIPFSTLSTHYYKLPLTDCVLNIQSINDTNLIVRLLIPVTKMSKHYKLIRLSKVPFYIRGDKKVKNDSKGSGSICEIKNYHHEDMFLVEYDTSDNKVTAIMKAPLACGPYHVCRIPDVVHRSLVDPCVEGIITGQEGVTKEACDFRCYDLTPEETKYFPYVIQLTSNRFAVIGATPNETEGNQVYIKCFGHTRIAAVKQNVLDEATLIVLPCPCEITTGNRSFAPQYPCNGTLEIMHVTHVIPDGTEGGFRFFDGDKTRTLQNDSDVNHHDILQGVNPASNGIKKQKPVDQVTNNSVKDKTTAKYNEDMEEDEEFLEDDVLFNTPFADNTNTHGDAQESILGDSDHAFGSVMDATGGDEYRGSHIAIWIIGFCILFTNLSVLYVLFKNNILTWEIVLLTRRE